MLRPVIAGFLLLCALPFAAFAHPASGIVVNEKGEVFFLDTGEPGGFRGFVWKIDAQGKLTAVHNYGGHWLALDASGSFSRSDLEGWFREKRVRLMRVRLSGSAADGPPELIQGDGSPIVIAPDGNLYYGGGEEPQRAGGEQITRLTPDGKATRLVADLSATAKRLGGIKGLAVGRDGSLSVTYPRAVQKITMTGAVSTVVDLAVMNDCEPSLRGLAVDSRGTVYAADSGCRAVVKITPNGRVQAVLKAERPWSPTGVAVRGDDVYVLEYANADGPAGQWLPRVRKFSRNGAVTALAAISAEERAHPAR
ncbi:MAG: hypothetical protein ACREUU_08965 [Gammaproteobacteria bacterium]